MQLASQPEIVEPVEQIRGYACTANDKKQHNTEEQVNEWKQWGELVAKQNLMSTKTVTGTKAKND
jgi:hypothetical protein